MNATRRVLPPYAAAFAALLLLCLFNAVATPGFFRLEARDGALYGAIVDVLKRGAQVAILAAASTFVIATRGVDLSVGAVMAVAGAIAAVLVQGGASFGAAAAAALAAATGLGAFNGLLVAAGGLPPIVATLVLMVAGRGVAQLVSDGQIVTFETPAFVALGNGRLLGLPVPVVVALALLGATTVVARRTALGLFVRAVGDNPAAARAAGVRIGPLTAALYAFSGFAAGVAGLIAAADIKAADANHAGLFLELDAILAVVIGGTALEGGRFSLAGSALGALVMQTTTTTLYMHDVSPDVAPVPKALVVLGVAALRSPVVRERLAARRARREARAGGGA